MASIVEMKQKASALRKRGLYQEAISLYRTLWEEHRSQCNEWDGWGYAFCLRKTKKTREALDVCREVYKHDPDFPHNRNLYAWCVYDLEIAKSEEEIRENEEQFLKAAKAILRMVKQDELSPFTKTILAVVDYLEAKASYPAKEIIDWLDRLDFSMLSTKCLSFEDGEGKTRELPSDRERWYAARSRALLRLGRYDECLKVSLEALDALPKLHYDNDIWFRWRIAECKGHLGDVGSAILQISELLRKREEWFMHKRIAELYFKQGCLDEALKHGIEAAEGPGDPEKKWELYLILAEILKAQGQIEDARKHAMLAFKLRQEHEWRIPKELKEMIQDIAIDTSSCPPAEAILEDLRPYWGKAKLASLPKLKGIVKKILPSGKAGFIKGEDGKDYYFKLKTFTGKREKLVPGLSVIFHIKDSFDRKKGVESKEAIDIKPF